MSDTLAPSEPSLGVWLRPFPVLFLAAYLFTRFSSMRGLVLGTFIPLACITPLALSWLLVVTEHVPAPYLDEVFHIPQAQVYCQGRYLEWDDKITTPPGLYISTIVFNKILRLPCTIYNLRGFNVLVVSLITVLVLICRARLVHIPGKPGADREITIREIATGINIGLFPVLFFFSGLYYTDPSSTLIVLLAYANHLTRVGAKPPSFLNDVYTLALGIVTLAFRQTNIFWVVVYMGGLEVVYAIKTLKPAPVETPKFQTLSDQIGFYAWRYSLGDVHDVSLSLAQPIDIVLCALSIGVAATCNLPTVLRRFLWPHGVILGAFVGFVAWNGGVVLGDKSNHVATLHLAQLLYIWPFFTFFSAPLFIPQLLNSVITTYQTITSEIRQKSLSGLLSRILSVRLVITVVLSCGALVVALLIVRFNTIIHPFTLADNRHYVFYVFRYSILRAWWIRYALAPVYIVCAWLCWAVLQGPQVPLPSQQDRIQSPFMSTQKPRSPHSKAAQDQSVDEVDAEAASPPTSTVLMLLVTTALSLMTAPLVEPRYFILPWVFWRLLIPTTSMPSLSSPSQPGRRTKAPKQSPSRRSHEASILLLETAWFVLINAATVDIFITRPFYWRAPDGTLQDEGRVQRFMW
ncbi:DIE2/ALG10 family-domain-containing protein [Xylaria bambusicola]|uniref:DIE2/ALG10 family-domain-containing protein n=1 Tax=Xylaria bambusicola TaxID=326684 RepID=UPI0020078D3A|nr:DIE2/ALG10 family-domain-containing protein [Xylaria bambusicola]KAI0521413.1 DIE2/ALG10 family-domain-containing protein [Xylaria bambusicola]